MSFPVNSGGIVESLNEQMDPAEVCWRSSCGNSKAMSSRYWHRECTVKHRKPLLSAGLVNARMTFDHLRSSKRLSAKELKIAKQIYYWMRKHGTRNIIFGAGKQNGSVYVATG